MRMGCCALEIIMHSNCSGSQLKYSFLTNGTNQPADEWASWNLRGRYWHTHAQWKRKRPTSDFTIVEEKFFSSSSFWQTKHGSTLHSFSHSLDRSFICYIRRAWCVCVPLNFILCVFLVVYFVLGNLLNSREKLVACKML